MNIRDIKQPTYEQIFDTENLIEAYKEMRKHKKKHEGFYQFDAIFEENLIIVQNELIYETYKPGEVFHKDIFDPRPRKLEIPCLKDRWIHHALVRVTTPVFEAYYHQGAYSCRVNRGTSHCVERWQQVIRKAIGRWNFDWYIVSIDFKSFFASIDREVLMLLIRHLFTDEKIVNLFRITINTVPGAKGLPLGFLSSQPTSNLYATPVDYLITDILGFGLYVRYADDIRVAVHTYEEAKSLIENVEKFALEKLAIRVNLKKTKITRFKGFDDFCGFKVRPHRLSAKINTTKRHERRCIKKKNLFLKKEITKTQYLDTIYSAIKYIIATKSDSNKIRNLLKEVLTCSSYLPQTKKNKRLNTFIQFVKNDY